VLLLLQSADCCGTALIHHPYDLTQHAAKTQRLRIERIAFLSRRFLYHVVD
jgi:hypothetical protein